ncbi:glutamate mutase L [Nocardioides sp. CPCC 205120]|uniref:glutamate mutase L n=1 Tax=Nocardioides sp. CPCC 205120 TaxID=3406462 RepID=UPI003B500E82
MRLAVCADLGSTWTKALLVGLDGEGTGRVLATAAHPTTLPGPASPDADLLDGYDACLAALLDARPEARLALAEGRLEQHACSSAGGGLRIAVVGNEALVTAEAGRRVALSSGGRVVAVHALADAPDLAPVLASRPDVVLLVGGTDGGNPEPLLAGARALVAGGWRGPVVVAGDVAAQPTAAEVLAAAGVPLRTAANVVPRIGELAPDGARAAVRELFLAHVIGGKALSRRPGLGELLRGATPDVVLSGVEVLAAVHGDVVVVDVGGATTDVYSVVEPDPEAAGRDVVAATRATRTVEADLGVRWSAAGVVEAAGLDDPALVAAAARRTADPGLVATTAAERAEDLALARAAVVAAVRRHAGRARAVERGGTDLRDVDLLVGSGGVLRHAPADAAADLLAAATGAGTADPAGWRVPRAPRVVVDTAYVLAAAGLLAAGHPAAARALVTAPTGGAAR